MIKDGFRASTLKEREEFYKKEFSVEKIKKWFAENKIKIPQICALDAGSETDIIASKKLKDKMLYFPFGELKKQVLRYLPEDVYYDRNRYENKNKILRNFNFEERKSQELAFDVDSDNFGCDVSIGEKEYKKCLEKTLKRAINLKNELEKKGFRKIKIIYSGRGFHVHVFDERGFYLTNEERKKLGKEFLKFGIDEWVSDGGIHLIRMPYSLNGLVSRIVTPLRNSN